MRSLISLVASVVWMASCFISAATTAKPFPASPALAASIVAFNASRLVCAEISEITSVTLLISLAALPSSLTLFVALPAFSTAS